MSIFINYFKLLDYQSRFKFFIIIVLLIISSLLETISIGSVFPLLLYTISPTTIEGYEFLKPFFALLNQFSINTSLLLIVLIIFAFTLKTIFQIFLFYFQSNFNTGISKEISRKLLIGYLNKPYSFFINTNSSFMIRNIITEASYLNNFTDCILIVIAEIFIIFGLISFLLIIRPLEIASAIFLIGIFAVSIIIVFKKIMERLGKVRQENDGHRIKYLQQIFQSIKDIKMRSYEKNFLRQFDDPNNKVASVFAKFLFIKSIPKLLIEFLLVILACLAILFLIQVEINFINTIPILGILTLVAYRLIPSANRIVSSVIALANGKAVLDLMNFEFQSFQEQELIENKNLNNIKEGLQLNNVKFKYQNQENPIIDDISLYLPYGKVIGIIGDSGSGKSTFIDILVGLLESQKGSFEVDGNKFDPRIKSWKDKISYVPQNISLIDDSISKNITLGLDQDLIDDVKLKRVIEVSNLAQVVDELPEKLETIIGERGAKLSGGQKQRIGIARALYKDYEILVLDEGTSALDYETEEKIIKNVRKFKQRQLVIFITHRHALLKHCDIVFKINNNNIVEIDKNQLI